MNIRFLASLAVLTFGSITALADTVTLTFTGLKDGEAIENYYNGGSGSLGSTGGPNYGIAFTSDSLAIISSNVGGSGNFDNVPPPATNTIAFFLSGAGDTMNVAAGFTTGFSFYYAAPYYTGTVDVFSGLNGTGTLLASDSLGETGAFCNGSSHDYSCWDQSGVSFAGSAESVVFSGVANYIGFADITLGSNVVPPPSSVTPEPNSLLLLGTGVIGAAGILRRRVAR